MVALPRTSTIRYSAVRSALTSRAQTDLAFRVFLQLGVEDAVPHPTTLTVFRGRLGEARFKEIFNRSVTVAVERGLVEGKLVLVDSYGIKADVAVPRRWGC